MSLKVSETFHLGAYNLGSPDLSFLSKPLKETVDKCSQRGQQVKPTSASPLSSPMEPKRQAKGPVDTCARGRPSQNVEGQLKDSACLFTFEEIMAKSVIQAKGPGSAPGTSISFCLCFPLVVLNSWLQLQGLQTSKSSTVTSSDQRISLVGFSPAVPTRVSELFSQKEDYSLLLV